MEPKADEPIKQANRPETRAVTRIAAHTVMRIAVRIGRCLVVCLDGSRTFRSTLPSPKGSRHTGNLMGIDGAWAPPNSIDPGLSRCKTAENKSIP